MSKKTKRYTAEFKAEAIKLALSAVSVSSVAKELGMPDATLHTWVQQAKAHGKQSYELAGGEKGSINVGELLSENQALRKRLAQLEQDKDILKKAAAYFARESK